MAGGVVVKVGDLIRYWNIDNESVFGVIVEDLGFFKKYDEEAVKVHWFDDNYRTEEKVSELTDPECEYFEVLNESR